MIYAFFVLLVASNVTRTNSPFEWPSFLGAGQLPGIGVSDRAFKRFRQGTLGCRVSFLDGYFQDYWEDQAFLDVCRKILEALTLQDVAAEERLEFAIHVRGSDFLHDDEFNLTTSEWYEDQFVRLSAIRRPRVVTIISDDTGTANTLRSHLTYAFPEVTFQLGLSGDLLHDFNLLRCAGTRIVGNSTFALWATALDTQGGDTIAPASFTRSRPRKWNLPWETLVDV